MKLLAYLSLPFLLGIAPTDLTTTGLAWVAAVFALITGIVTGAATTLTVILPKLAGMKTQIEGLLTTAANHEAAIQNNASTIGAVALAVPPPATPTFYATKLEAQTAEPAPAAADSTPPKGPIAAQAAALALVLAALSFLPLTGCSPTQEAAAAASVTKADAAATQVASNLPPALVAGLQALAAKHPEAAQYAVSFANGLESISGFEGKLPSPTSTQFTLLSWVAGQVPVAGPYITDFVSLYTEYYQLLPQTGATLSEIAEVIRNAAAALPPTAMNYQTEFVASTSTGEAPSL